MIYNTKFYYIEDELEITWYLDSTSQKTDLCCIIWSTLLNFSESQCSEILNRNYDNQYKTNRKRTMVKRNKVRLCGLERSREGQMEALNIKVERRQQT